MSYSFPAFDGKHEEQPLVGPDHEIEASGLSPADFPDVVVVCYQPELFEYVRENHAERELFADHYMIDLVVLEDERIGVVGDFGIGAPATAMVVEALGAGGVEAFLSTGYAGCLQTDVQTSDVIVTNEAIRDEGTSHHYLEPAERVEPTPELAADARAAAVDADRTAHEGPTWTIDAAYRETRPEIEQYAEDGVLTVEMEAAAVFAVARHHGYEAAALLIVSDYLGTEEWEPKFDETTPHLEELFEISLDAARRYLGGK